MDPEWDSCIPALLKDPIVQMKGNLWNIFGKNNSSLLLGIGMLLLIQNMVTVLSSTLHWKTKRSNMYCSNVFHSSMKSIMLFYNKKLLAKSKELNLIVESCSNLMQGEEGDSDRV